MIGLACGGGALGASGGAEAWAWEVSMVCGPSLILLALIQASSSPGLRSPSEHASGFFAIFPS